MVLLKDLLKVIIDKTEIYMFNTKTNEIMYFYPDEILEEPQIGELKVLYIYYDCGMCIRIEFNKTIWDKYE